MIERFSAIYVGNAREVMPAFRGWARAGGAEAS